MVAQKDKMPRRSIPTDLSLLSLYSGAGGLDTGLVYAGFGTRLCVENDEDSRETLCRNHPQWRLSEPGDVHELGAKGVLEQSGLKPRELTLLAAGPPCQPFSKSGYWATGDAQRLADPRADTLSALLDVVGLALPRVVLLENVKGFAYRNKDEGLRLIQRGLEQINRRAGTSYRPALLSLNCAAYGVPQRRERVFLVAERDSGIELQAPAPTHGDPVQIIEEGTELEPYRTAWDAIGDLEHRTSSGELALKGHYAELLPSIPEGQNYLWHTPGANGEPLFGWRTRYWSFLLKLAKNRPSWTIQAQPGPSTGPFHWRNRRLSVEELLRLQTFPDGYEITGTYRSQHRQIGNAVPPAIGQLLGFKIRQQLLGQRPIEKSDLIPAACGEAPRQERITAVPEKYWHMRGNHARHGGTGKGPGATFRAASPVTAAPESPYRSTDQSD
jgi:DNA (cytosine-5)-methyltransferase 1